MNPPSIPPTLGSKTDPPMITQGCGIIISYLQDQWIDNDQKVLKFNLIFYFTCTYHRHAMPLTKESVTPFKILPFNLKTLFYPEEWQGDIEIKNPLQAWMKLVNSNGMQIKKVYNNETA